MSDLVESAIALHDALARVGVARYTLSTYAGDPPEAVAQELLDAAESVRCAVVALAGGA